MGLKKGQCNNLSGRKVGSKNRNTTEIKTAIQNILDTNISQMESDLKKLTPRDRINILLKLADFVLPKIQSVPSVNAESDNEIIIRIVE